MISKLKMYLGIAVTAAFALLAGFGSYQKRRAEKAETKAEIAETEVKHTEQRIERHESREEIESDIALGDEPSIDERLSKYYRD